MIQKLREVKSEAPNMFLRKKIKAERVRTPLRFSRRIRHLPPEATNFFNSIREQLKKEKQDARHIISRESSTQIRHNHKSSRFRKLNYPQRVRNSKEVISILSAPKLCNKKYSNGRRVAELPMQVRGSSCRPKIVVKEQHSPVHSHYTITKNIKKEMNDADKILEKRKKYVLEVLNKGDMRDIEKLHSIGTKTAERIIFYRQLRGSINKISELAKMPKFPKKRFNNFVAQNFLNLTK